MRATWYVLEEKWTKIMEKGDETLQNKASRAKMPYTYWQMVYTVITRKIYSLHGFYSQIIFPSYPDVHKINLFNCLQQMSSAEPLT